MSAEVVNIRDYQSKKAIARAHAELEKHMVEIANMAFPNVLEAHYPEPANAFHAPDTDSA